MTEKNQELMEKIVSLCKRRGFIFPGSEIYGGLAGTFDYGPLGVALKNNIKSAWWKRFVENREDMYGVDAAILMNANAWKASGHVGGFNDPMIECGECNTRFRVDHLGFSQNQFDAFVDGFTDINISILENTQSRLDALAGNFENIESISQYYKIITDDIRVVYQNLLKEIDDVLDGVEKDQIVVRNAIKEITLAKKYLGNLTQIFLNLKFNCPICKQRKWGVPREFNMMFKTNFGATESDDSITYLRPETAGGMFVNFKNIVDTFHPKLPFGMAQIGKAFRNEIAPRDFIFRVREFEQMEIEYFVKPSEWESVFEGFVVGIYAFMNDIGLPKTNVHELEVADGDRAHYSKRTIDFEFDYPFGRKELYGLAYRTDFDLSAHSTTSGTDLSYFDEETKERFIPHCVEPSFGLDRSVLAVLSSAYTEDELGGETRSYLKFSPKIAPVLVAVSPLLKNKPELVAKAREVFGELKKKFGRVTFDDNGNIGKRYRRQDEIGTPFCVVIDFETIEQGTGVTVRDRDTGEQKRMQVPELIAYIEEKLN